MEHPTDGDDHQDGERRRPPVVLTDALPLARQHVVLALEEGPDGTWLGVWPFRTANRAKLILDLVEQVEDGSDFWERWRTPDGRVFWLAREEVQ